MEKNMEHEMETPGPNEGVCRDITRIMENQMETWNIKWKLLYIYVYVYPYIYMYKMYTYVCIYIYVCKSRFLHSKARALIVFIKTGRVCQYLGFRAIINKPLHL